MKNILVLLVIILSGLNIKIKAQILPCSGYPRYAISIITMMITEIESIENISLFVLPGRRQSQAEWQIQIHFCKSAN